MNIWEFCQHLAHSYLGNEWAMQLVLQKGNVSNTFLIQSCFSFHFHLWNAQIVDEGIGLPSISYGQTFKDQWDAIRRITLHI